MEKKDNIIKRCINTLLNLFKKIMIMGNLNILSAAKVEVYARSKHIDKNLIKSEEIYKYLKPDTEIKILKLKGNSNKYAVLDEVIIGYNNSVRAFNNYFKILARDSDIYLFKNFKNEIENDPEYLNTVDIYKAGFNEDDDKEKIKRYHDAAAKLYGVNDAYIDDFRIASVNFDKAFTTEKIKAGDVDVIANIEYNTGIITMAKRLINISHDNDMSYKYLLRNVNNIEEGKLIVAEIKEVMKKYNKLYLFYIDLFESAYRSYYNITLAAMKDYVATRDNKDTKSKEEI